jgi:hypothetical protein
MKAPVPPPASPDSKDESGTGLPGFRSWTSVYLFVLGFFSLFILLLALLTHRYS